MVFDKNKAFQILNIELKAGIWLFFSGIYSQLKPSWAKMRRKQNLIKQAWEVRIRGRIVWTKIAWTGVSPTDTINLAGLRVTDTGTKRKTLPRAWLLNETTIKLKPSIKLLHHHRSPNCRKPGTATIVAAAEPRLPTRQVVGDKNWFHRKEQGEKPRLSAPGWAGGGRVVRWCRSVSSWVSPFRIRSTAVRRAEVRSSQSQFKCTLSVCLSPDIDRHCKHCNNSWLLLLRSMPVLTALFSAAVVASSPFRRCRKFRSSVLHCILTRLLLAQISLIVLIHSDASDFSFCLLYCEWCIWIHVCMAFTCNPHSPILCCNHLSLLPLSTNIGWVFLCIFILLKCLSAFE